MKAAVVVALLGLAATASAQEAQTLTYWTPAPTTKPPATPAPTTKPPATPAPTTKPPGTPAPTKPGGTGDPIMTGLDGRSFEFMGKAGLVYNVLSEKNHQVSMKLKEGHMWDHVGTYMTAIGFRYLDHTVEVAEDGDSLSVTLDGTPLAMRPSQTEQEVILGLAEGEMSLLWQLHRADYGSALEVTTDMMQLVCWMTPAGTRDEGGKVQPAYLNFELTLLATPAHNTLEGIVGATYANAISADKAEDDFKFHGVEAEYEMAGLFETSHAKSVFGKAHAGRARKLIESAVFPMRASTRGFFPVLRASSQGLIARNRKALN